MSNWKTSLGGAVSVTGTTLMGVGVLGMTGAPDYHSGVYWYIALIGFIMSAVGKGLAALFPADASRVRDLEQRVDSVESEQSDRGGR